MSACQICRINARPEEAALFQLRILIQQVFVDVLCKSIADRKIVHV